MKQVLLLSVIMAAASVLSWVNQSWVNLSGAWASEVENPALSVLVVDVLSREAVDGAFVSVFLDGALVTNTVTSASGRVTLRLAPGKYSLSVSGWNHYRSRADAVVEKDAEVIVPLVRKRDYDLGEVEVVARKTAVASSRVVVDKQDLQDHTVGVTADPLGMLNRLAGIDQTTPFAYGNPTRITVRGGSGLENRTEVEGFFIPNPWHRIIPDSIFLFDIIKDIEIRKDGIPADTGQLLSSLLRVSLSDGAGGFHGRFMSSLINTSLVLEGSAGGVSWSAGVRRTHYDLIMDLFTRPNSQTDIEVPYYWDSQGKVVYAAQDDSLKLVWNYTLEPVQYLFVSADNSVAGGFGIPGNVDTHGQAFFQDAMTGLEWKRQLSAQWSMDQKLEWNYCEEFIGYRFLMEPDAGSRMTRFTRQNRFAYDGGWTWSVKNLALVRFGLNTETAPNVVMTNQLYSIKLHESGVSSASNILDSCYNGSWYRTGFYASAEGRLWGDRAGWQAGVRADIYSPVKDPVLDPRLSIDYRVESNNRLFLSAEKFSLFPFDAWNFSLLDRASNIQVPGCVQCTAGYEWGFPSIGLRGILDCYYKDYTNALTPESNTVIRLLTAGSGRVAAGMDLGADFQLKGLPLKAGLQAGAVFIRERKDIGDDPGGLMRYSPDGITADYSIINDPGTPPLSRWYSPSAPRYKLNLEMVWDFFPGWTATAEFYWREGESYTPVILGSAVRVVTTNAYNGITKAYQPALGGYLSERYEDDHHLDLQVAWKGAWAGLSAGFFLTVINVYDHRPVIRWQYNDSYTAKTAVQNPLGIYGSAGFWIGW